MTDTQEEKNLEQEELQEEEESIAPWVQWFRGVAPHIHSIKNQTIVIAVSGEMIERGKLESFIHDVSVISALGSKLVLVYGVRPQVERLLKLQNIRPSLSNNIRITEPETLSCVKEAAGEVRLDIEAAFSQGLPNTPMAHSHVRVVSGNFVIARPLGIIDGIDFKLTGIVRKVDSEAIHQQLNNKNIVLVAPLGFSPTGEAFNLTLEDVASSIAGAIKADKLVLLSDVDGVRRFGEVISELTAEQAEEFVEKGLVDQEDIYNLGYALKAIKKGVDRVHIIPYFLDGGILGELFTHDGVGTLITEEHMESMKTATIDDLQGLIKLLQPLEEDGTLVKRPREKLEADISKFIVLEHDGIIYGSAALYAFPEEKIGEMGALTVHPDYQGKGEADKLLRQIEKQARKEGLTRLFVLTTRTAHWFLKKGFRTASLEELPLKKRDLYNWQRRSQIFIKDL